MWRGRWFLLMVVALPLVLGACDWSQGGFDAANTGYNPSEPALTSASVQHLEEAWFYDDASQALVANGRVFTVRRTGLGTTPDLAHALDVTTGAARWSTTLPAGSFLRAVGNGLVYYQLDGGGTTTLDAETAGPRWGRPETPLLLDGTRLFASSGSLQPGASEQLVAIDPNGAVLWSTTSAGEIVGSAVRRGQLVVLTFIPIDQAPGGIVLLSTYSESDGTLVRRVPVAAKNSAGQVMRPSGLSVGGDLVYFTTASPNVNDAFAANPETGAVAWHVPRADIAGLVVTPTAIVLTTSNVNGTAGQVLALDPANGAVRWSKDVLGRVQGATATGSLVFVGHTSFDPLLGMLVYDLRTGALVTSSTTVCCAPFPSNGHVFASGVHGLTALVPAGRP